MSTTTPVTSNGRAVIFDISGTTLDYGSRGPVVAFVELFVSKLKIEDVMTFRKPGQGNYPINIFPN